MLIDNLFAVVLFFLSIYWAAAKHSLVEGIIESEKSFATTGDYNLTALMNDTFDGLLLENFIKVFNADLEILSNAKDRLGNNTLSKNLNFNALRYFLYVQSQLIDQIENPFSSNKQSLEALNFDFQFSEDQELTNYIKINFLALMEFWKEYIWIYHLDSKKNSLKIHDTYVRLISSIFSTVTSKNSTYSITPFEWIKSFCKWTVDKASIFLNPAHLIAKTIQKDFGIMPPNIDINENTKTNLPSSFYYAPQTPQAENFAANANEVAGGPVNTATPGGTLGADGNPVQNVGNEAINPADNQFGPNPEANPNPNINGIRNGGGWFGNWFGFLGNFWNKDKKANEEPLIIKYNEDKAKETNNSQIYYQLAATFIFGDQKHGILPNRTKALMYFAEASNRGNSEAMYNLGVMNLEEDLNTSYKWFQKWADANFSLWFKGLAVIYGYNHPNNTYFNMTKSEEYFDLAINLGN